MSLPLPSRESEDVAAASAVMLPARKTAIEEHCAIECWPSGLLHIQGRLACIGSTLAGIAFIIFGVIVHARFGGFLYVVLVAPWMVGALVA